MIQALVFDFGNVVGFFDHRRATRRLAAHGELPSERIYAELFGGALEDAYESGRLTTSDYLARLRALCHPRCSDEELQESYADIFWPNPDMAALLPRLKPRYQLLLGSNTNELHARQFSRQFADTLSLFDAMVLSHEIGARKPSAAFFEHCCRRAGRAAEQCLFIDDLEANVAGARACGWHGIVYTGMKDLCSRLDALGIVLDDPKAPNDLLPSHGRTL